MTSSSMTIQQISASLKRGAYAPFYFLQGSEVYYIDQIVAYIEKNALTAAEKSLNFRCYYGKEHAMNEILGRARCLPMLGKRQVVIVKEAQEMSDLHHPKGQKLLLAYLGQANPQTVLVFSYKHKTLRKKALLEAITEHGHTLFSTPKVYERQIPAWMGQFVTKAGYGITEEAKGMLQHLIGTDLRLLSSELKKLMVNISSGDKITGELVTKHIGMQRDVNNFELQRAIEIRETKKALAIVKYFSKNEKKHPAIPLVSLLATFFLKVLQIHHLRGVDGHQQAEKLQVPSYFIKDYLLAAQKHPRSLVVEHLHALHKADLQLKGVAYPATRPSEVIKELVVSLLKEPNE